MFKRKTLFIIGAGASAEVNLPVGITLASQIRGRLDIYRGRHSGENDRGDTELFRQICRKWPNEDALHHAAAWKIRDGILLANSIDDFLDAHRSDGYVQRVGKAAIAKYILEAERRSSLYIDPSNIYNRLDLTNLTDTWYVRFMRMLARNAQFEKIDTLFENVGFIVFNYDRCIEHFLLHALRALYSIDERRASELLSSLDIVHPYGSIGPLPLNGTGVGFGGGNTVNIDHVAMSSNIRTYTEQISDDTMVAKIRDQVESADNLVFLGFAFHDQNVALLRPEEQLRKSKNIYGTALGMSQSDISVATEQLSLFFDTTRRLTIDAKIRLSHAETCSGLFDFYTKSLPA